MIFNLVNIRNTNGGIWNIIQEILPHARGTTYVSGGLMFACKMAAAKTSLTLMTHAQCVQRHGMRDHWTPQGHPT